MGSDAQNIRRVEVEDIPGTGGARRAGEAKQKRKDANERAREAAEAALGIKRKPKKK